MSEASSLVDSIVRDRLAKRLKTEGFKKHSRTWVRSNAALSHVVNVQASQWNFEDQAKFTINLGVYVPAVAERRGIVAKGSYPKEYDSTVRARIGSLMPDRLDHWWAVSRASDLASVAADVEETFMRFGAPWLASLATVEEVFKLLLGRGDDLMAASAALALDRRADAEQIIAKAIASANPVFAPTVLRFAQKHGVPVAAA